MAGECFMEMVRRTVMNGMQPLTGVTLNVEAENYLTNEPQ